MFKNLNARKPVVGVTDYPTKINGLIDDLKNAANLPGLPFSYKEDTTIGLTLGLYGGQMLVNGALTTIADTTAAGLAPSTVNYIEHDAAGVVSSNAVGFSANKYPIGEATTDTATITGYVDRRNLNTMMMPGRIVIDVAGGVGTTVLTAAQWRNDVIEFTGALTGNRTIEVPTTVSHQKLIRNGTTGAFTLTVKTAAGTGVTVTQGARGSVMCDGINVVASFNDGALHGGGFPSGTRMLFQQTAAPTGWTKEAGATYNDAALRIVTGAVGTGGADAFSVHFGVGKSTAGYALTVADMPAHDHGGATGNASATIWTQAVDPGNRDIRDGGFADNNALPTAAVTHTIPSQGGGGAHSHTLNNFNLKFADVIIATKD